MTAFYRKKRYEKRTDLEKVQSQWHKGTGLHGRKEASAAIVRAATAAELAANFAVRKEFKSRSKFSAAVVDEFLKSANGLSGKINKLLIPLATRGSKRDSIKRLQPRAQKISEMRNRIVHSGEFCNEKEAEEIIATAREFIEELVHLYTPKFKLKDQI